MSEGRNLAYNSGDNSNDSPCESEGRQISSPTQLPRVYIDHETGYDTISTLNSVPGIVLEAAPPPPRISAREIKLDRTNITKKLAPPVWGPKGYKLCKTAFNRERERGDSAIMEAKSQNLQVNELRAVTRDCVSSSQSYMKRELNKYRAQTTKMVSLSAEIKAAIQNITEMKSTVRSLNGKVKAKKLKADEELERKIDDQKELLKDVKLKHEKMAKELQAKINDQKQLVKDAKDKKKKLMTIFSISSSEDLFYFVLLVVYFCSVALRSDR